MLLLFIGCPAACSLAAPMVATAHLQDVAAVLAAEYPEGVNVVYEGVGGALREAIMAHLAPGARVLQVCVFVCPAIAMHAAVMMIQATN